MAAASKHRARGTPPVLPLVAGMTGLAWSAWACLGSATARAQAIEKANAEIIFELDGEKIDYPEDTLAVVRDLPLDLLRNALLTELGKSGRYRDMSLSESLGADGRTRFLLTAEKLRRVFAIGFSGLGFQEEGQYRRALKTQVGSPFNAQDIDLDVARLVQRLQERGYMSARVTNVSFEENEQGDSRVVFEVDRGRPCRVAEVKVEPEKSVLDFITSPVEPGSICDRIAIEDALERERNRLRLEGFLDVELALVGVSYTADRERAAVKLRVERGKRTVIQVINQATGSVTEDLTQGRTGISPFDLAFLSEEDLRNEVLAIYHKRGYPNAVVSGPTRYAAPRDEVVLRFFLQPGTQVSIGKVEFQGVLPLPRKEIIETLELEPKIFSSRVPYVEAELGRMRERLATLYYDNGYADARVDAPEVTFSPDGKFANLTFRVDAGERYTVRDFTMLGKPRGFEPDEDALFKILGPGEPVSTSRLRNLEDETKIQLMRMGYAYARVTARLSVLPPDKDLRPVQVVLEMDHGPVVRIGQIFAEGELYGKQDRVIKETGLEPGDLFTPENLDQARLRILRHDLYGNVTVEALNPTALERRDAVIDVVVRTLGRSGFTLGLSPGYGTRNGYRFSVDFTKNNLTADGLRLTSSASVSQEKLQGAVIDDRQILGRKITVGLVEPLFRMGNWVSPFDVAATVGLEVAAQSLDNRYFETADAGLSWKPTFFERNWQFGGKFAYEWSRTIGGTLAPIEALDRPTQRINEVIFGASLDTRNLVEWPTRGGLYELTSSFARFGLGSEVRYDRYGLDFAHFVPLFERVSGAIALGGMRLSNVTNERSETVTAPASRRGNLSGRALVRGFPEGGTSLAPGPLLLLRFTDQSGGLCEATLRNTGASNLLYLKSELRYRSPWLGDALGFVGFVDTGSAYFTDAEQRDLQASLERGLGAATTYTDANGCRLTQIKLLQNSEVSLKKSSFIEDYFRTSYVSTGLGLRYIIPSFAYVSLDWGIPLRDPADSNPQCLTQEEATSDATRSVECVKRRSRDKLLFVLPVPGTFHIGIGASF